MPRCPTCLLWGHEARQCPDSCCAACKHYGHTAVACQACEYCQQYGHTPEDCPTLLPRRDQRPREPDAAAAAQSLVRYEGWRDEAAPLHAPQLASGAAAAGGGTAAPVAASSSARQGGWPVGPTLPDPPPPRPGKPKPKAEPPARVPVVPRNPAAAANWQQEQFQLKHHLGASLSHASDVSESSSVWQEVPDANEVPVWEEAGGDWEATGRAPLPSPSVGAAAAAAGAAARSTAGDLLQPLSESVKQTLQAQPQQQQQQDTWVIEPAAPQAADTWGSVVEEEPASLAHGKPSQQHTATQQQQQQEEEVDAASEPVSLAQLLPEHTAELAAALPEGMLPAGWQFSYATWEELERGMRWAVKGFTRMQVRPEGAAMAQYRQCLGRVLV